MRIQSCLLVSIYKYINLENTDVINYQLISYYYAMVLKTIIVTFSLFMSCSDKYAQVNKTRGHTEPDLDMLSPKKFWYSISANIFMNKDCTCYN